MMYQDVFFLLFFYRTIVNCFCVFLYTQLSDFWPLMYKSGLRLSISVSVCLSLSLSLSLSLVSQLEGDKLCTQVFFWCFLYTEMSDFCPTHTFTHTYTHTYKSGLRSCVCLCLSVSVCQRVTGVCFVFFVHRIEWLLPSDAWLLSSTHTYKRGLRSRV